MNIKQALLTAFNRGGAAVPWYQAGGVALSDVGAVWSPETADTLANSYLRIAGDLGYANISPSVLGVGVAPTLSTGWNFAAGGRWLETGITPVANMSYLVKFSVATEGQYAIGEQSTNASIICIPNLASNAGVRYGNGGTVDKAPSMTEGIIIVAGNKCYRNGVDDGVTIPDFSGTAGFTVNIGRLNRATPAGYYLGKIQRLAFWKKVLTPAEFLAIYGAASSPFSPTPAGAGEIMLVHMTDTHWEDEATSAIHQQMTSWLASNSATLGLDVVLHGGDIVYSPVADATQWADAGTMFDNLGSGIPYLVTCGNHDHDGDVGTDVIGRATTNFNGAFPQSRYTGKSWWDGGFYEAGRSENAYLLMTLESTDWIFISMEFGPRNAVLAWVDGLLTTYAARHAVIITHSHIHRDGSQVTTGTQYAPSGYTLDGLQNDGAAVWTALKDHDNIRLILSGHDKGTGGWATAKREDLSDGGISTNQMVANWQSYFNAASGMMRFIRINPTAKTIAVQSYSPRLNMFMHDAANEFTVDWTP